MGKEKPYEGQYSLEALSKPDLYESDEVVKKAAKIVIDAFYPEGEMSRGDWKKKVRSGGEAERVKDFLDREAKKALIGQAKLEKAKAIASELKAPEGYSLTVTDGEILLKGPWCDDLHARIKRIGGAWESAGWDTGREGRKAWVIPESKAESLRKLLAKSAEAMSEARVKREKEAEKAAAEKAEADRLKEEARAAAPKIEAGQYGTITVKSVEGGYRVMFPYDAKRVAEIKAKGGKNFDSVEKSWFFDAADAASLKTILEKARDEAALKPGGACPSKTMNTLFRKRVLFPLSVMPAFGSPRMWDGKVVVFESKGSVFRITEDHPSMHGSHLLGHEGEFGAYVYYRNAIPEEVKKWESSHKEAK